MNQTIGLKLSTRSKATLLALALWRTGVCLGQLPSLEAKPPESPLVKWGIFNLFPSASAGILYDDNIYIRPEDKTRDVIWSFSPAILSTAGEPGEQFLRISYAPTFNFFTDESKNNSVDHDGSFLAERRFTRLTIGLRQDFLQLSDAVVDIGSRAERQIYTTSLNSKYDFSDKTTFEVNGRVSINDYGVLLGYREFLNQNWINHQTFPKVNLGAGLGFGYLDVDNAEDGQTFQQAQLRGIYNLTGKLLINASFGAELRQYGGDEGQRLTPILSIGAAWKPREETTLSLTASRREQNSVVFQGQNYVISDLNASLRQQVLQNFFVTVAGGFANYDYRPAASGASVSRSDDYFFARLGFEWIISSKWALAAHYLYRENMSSEPTADFSNNQAGVQVRARF